VAKYSNSEKISASYLDKEKKRILGLISGKTYPFMECYREKLRSISEEQDNYVALKKYMALNDELSTFLESEEYDLKLAKYYLSLESDWTTVGYMITDWFFKSLTKKYLIPEIGCLTELQSLMRDYFSKHAYCKNFYLSYWYWEAFAKKDKLICPFLRGVMKIPDKRLLSAVFDFLERCSVTTEEIEATLIYLYWKARDDIYHPKKSSYVNSTTIEKTQDEYIVVGLMEFMYEKNKMLLNDYRIQYVLLSYIPYFYLGHLRRFDSTYGKIEFKPNSTYRYVAVIIKLLIEWYETDSMWHKIMEEEYDKVPV